MAPQISHPRTYRKAEFRFYEELGDFLPLSLRKRSFVHRFVGHPSIKDRVEAIGVPHTEVDLLLVNGVSVDFSYKMRGGERVAVYPMFESLDISPLIRLRAKPLRVTRFVVDVHLGRLAGYLRLLGFDTRYHNKLMDAEIVGISLSQRRIALTRDLGLLKHGRLTHGYWVRNVRPRRQAEEVVRALQLEGVLRPFSRCSACNGLLTAVAKAEVVDSLPARVKSAIDLFYRCGCCAKVYWRGSHTDSITSWIESLKHSDRGPEPG